MTALFRPYEGWRWCKSDATCRQSSSACPSGAARPRCAELEELVVRTDIVITVYGRFHYALDIFAGWALALTVVGLYRLSDRGEETPRPL